MINGQVLYSKQWFIERNTNDRGFRITPLIETINADIQQFGILGVYLAVDEFTLN